MSGRTPVKVEPVLIVAVGLAVVAALGSRGEPTGLALVDAVLRGGLVLTVVLVAGRAPPTLVALPAAAGVVLAVAGLAPWPGLVALTAAASVAWACSSARPGSTAELALATAGGLGVVSLLWAPDIGAFGLTTLVGVAAVAPLLVMGVRRGGRGCRRLTWALLALAGVAGALGLVAAVGALARGRAGADHLEAARAAAREGEADRTVDELTAAAERLRDAQGVLAGPLVAPARLLPLVGIQLDEVADTLGSAATAADGARQGLGAADADVAALKLRDGAVDVAAVAALADPLTVAADRLEQVHADAAARPAASWVAPPVRSLRERYLVRLVAIAGEARLAARTVAVAPRLLGADRPRRYLVLLASPAETRELGGFVGSYAIVVADQGKVSLERTGRATGLEDDGGEGRSLPDPSSFPSRYVGYRPERFWQNVTGTASFPDVARAARALFPQSGGGEVDGVVSLDPHALAAFLRLTGPVWIPSLGRALGADEAPGVLLREQYVRFPVKEQRVVFLDQVVDATFAKLTTGELPSPTRLAAVLGPMVEQRRLLAWVPDDPEAAGALRDLGLTGELPQPDGGDLLAVANANANPSKIDAYLERTIEYRPRHDPITGAVTAELEVTLRNTAPASGLPDYVIGSKDKDLPRGTNRTLVSAWSPLRLGAARAEITSVNGPTEVPRLDVERAEEYGWNRYSAYVNIPAGSTAVVRLELAGSLTPGDAYRLTLLGQPVAAPDEVEVAVSEGADAGWTWQGRSTGGTRQLRADP
jgi:hypothetical protein